MKHTRLLLFSLAWLGLPISCYAQPWSGVLAPSRAIDWSTAGIPGGIPSASWTQCGSTIAAYSGTAAAINTALANCPANHYVQLGAGTFTLSTGIAWTKSNVALRGMGANQTIIAGSGNGACPGGYGYNAMVSICSTDGTGLSPGSSFNWTAGYSQGSTSLSLSGTTGMTANQTLVVLDQCDDGYSGSSCSTGSSTDTGAYYVCSDQYSSAGHGCGTEIGTNAYRTRRSQIQLVVPSAVSSDRSPFHPPESTHPTGAPVNLPRHGCFSQSYKPESKT